MHAGASEALEKPTLQAWMQIHTLHALVVQVRIAFCSCISAVAVAQCMSGSYTHKRFAGARVRSAHCARVHQQKASKEPVQADTSKRIAKKQHSQKASRERVHDMLCLNSSPENNPAQYYCESWLYCGRLHCSTTNRTRHRHPQKVRWPYCLPKTRVRGNRCWSCKHSGQAHNCQSCRRTALNWLMKKTLPLHS
jgi:hypothetical protein